DCLLMAVTHAEGVRGDEDPPVGGVGPTERLELIGASDETIDDAVTYADPMVLRGLLYQLTGDESVARTRLGTSMRSWLEISAVTDEDDVALLRRTAAAFLRAFRDGGGGECSAGPPDRLKTSVDLTVGFDVPAEELDLYVEELALDVRSRGVEWGTTP